VPDNTYLISDPAKSLTVPLYMVVPANANIKCKYTLGASTPAFVSLVGDPDRHVCFDSLMRSNNQYIIFTH